MRDFHNNNKSEKISSKPVLTKAEKLEKLPWNIAFVTTNAIAIHLTFTGSIFVLYLNQLGINKTLLGTILSLLPFINILSVIVAPKLAKSGVRKIFLISFATRYLIWGLIILSPWVQQKFGQEWMVLLILAVVLVFSFLRMLNMTAILPWNQEIIPDSIRGKFLAKRQLLANLANIITVTLAGIYIENAEGIAPFNVLFVIGVIFGLISAWEAAHFPGGDPKEDESLSSQSTLSTIFEPLKDENFRKYIIGMGLIILGESLFSFLPLYMSEEIGLSSGNIVLLQTGALVGGALMSYLWGWAADRFGSKPVLHVSMVLIAFLPIFWFTMPYHSPISLYVALAIAFVQGFAQMGRFIGGSRLLYNRMVPPKQNTAYMGFYNAWLGLVMGVSQLFGGFLLDAVSGISGELWQFPINNYSVMFGLIFGFALLAILITSFVKAEGEVSMGEFVGLFLRGNPLLAIETLISYQRPKTERETINLTERMGLAQSHLTNEELQASLEDPRFYVRYEAIVSIARHNPHPQLTESLIAILNGKDPALSVVSAWALGRIGGSNAINALRNALRSSDYRSVRAHSARSLAALADEASIPTLITLFKEEPDRGLQQAYAAALGQLGVTEVFDEIYDLLVNSSFHADQMELALSLGRLVGDEDDFIRINRQLEEDFNTAASRLVSSFRWNHSDSNTDMEISMCALAFARNELKSGCETLLTIAKQTAIAQGSTLAQKMIARLEVSLSEGQAVRKDLLTLLIFILYELSERKIT